MKLTVSAIKDLRGALQKSYGDDFDVVLSDEEIENIGLLLLTCLVESLKLEIVNPELFTKHA